MYNNYKVYYQGAESEFDFKEIQLGQSRKNGETWCIYESPVGGFSDRVGSRHYEAMCYNGEEIIRAPIITKANDGSQFPNTSKKLKTFSGLIISEITNPVPKIIPASREINLFIYNF